MKQVQLRGPRALRGPMGPQGEPMEEGVGVGVESTFDHGRIVMANEHSHPPSHNIRKKKTKNKQNQKTHHHNKQTRQPQIICGISFLRMKF